jgi:hypothetical protein
LIVLQILNPAEIQLFPDNRWPVLSPEDERLVSTSFDASLAKNTATGIKDAIPGGLGSVRPLPAGVQEHGPGRARPLAFATELTVLGLKLDSPTSPFKRFLRNSGVGTGYRSGTEVPQDIYSHPRYKINPPLFLLGNYNHYSTSDKLRKLEVLYIQIS